MLDSRNITHRQGLLLLIIVGLLWSTGGLLLKYVHWHPLAIAGARSAVAAVVALLFLGRPRFRWSYTQIGASLTYAATVILFVLSNKLTTAANAILLQYTAPIYVAIFGLWFLGERATLRDWLAVAAVFGGIALFFCDQLSVRGIWGNLSALAAGISYAWFALFLRKDPHTLPLEPVVLGNLIAALVGLPFMFISPPSISSLAVVALLGTVQLGLPFVLYVIASRKVTALDLALVPAVEPILNPIWVLLFYGETPTPWAILGGSVVVAAITLRSLLAGKPRIAAK